MTWQSWRACECDRRCRYYSAKLSGLNETCELLRSLYGHVVIPHAVRNEMLAEGAPHDVRMWVAALPDWVDVVSAVQHGDPLTSRLGTGEREAIQVALEIGADVLLMDDQPGRLAAEARGLFVSGTLSVLLQASRSGLVDFESALSQLQQLKFRVSSEVIATMRSLARRPL